MSDKPPTTVDPRIRHAVTILRVAIASVFIIHGVARMVLGTVGGFGQFLSSSGLPLGTVIAWVLTVVEVLGGIALALGVGTRLLALWFAAQITVGIVLVHSKAGWFVVGAGRNGAEYSALILVCLLVVAMTDSVAHGLRIKGK